ncbi:NUDIX domain-containing protein [Nocardioides sp. CPCC 205120]|uniref:NUDIX domain-containing protein n=1 Tax=Nocardioides sp. CPCC 205120 TaxID=3406462 RepID=UPI003B5102D9
MSGRVVHENPWIVVTQDEVVRPDGTPGTYGVVELRSPAVIVVAITDDDEVVLVRCDRYTTGPGWEVPAGGADDDDPLTAARRELGEEAGLVAEHWRDLGPVTSLNGVCRAPGRVFLARGLRPAPERVEQAVEGISEVRAVPWAELLGMVAAGEVPDGETLAALLLAAVAEGRVAGGPTPGG